MAEGDSNHELEFIFHPRSVAIAGVSTRENLQGISGWNFVSALLDVGFPNPIYLLHPTARAIRGLRAYRSLLDIPDDVDYVISSVNARNVPDLLDDCIRKGTVRLLHLFTAGFTETGEASKADMEQTLVSRARAAGIRVVGPNCMGIYAPESRLAIYPNQPSEAGPIGMISQSGANAGEFVRQCTLRGLRISKAISFGNGTDLKAADFFDYFAEDPKTEVIAAYVEGIQDGPRLAAAIRKASDVKPVAILKGGRTEAGGRATSSHTASLAGSIELFDALCRQAGAVRVDSMESLVDMAVTFRYLKRIPGPNVAVVGGGGGPSVLAADDVNEAGLRLPVFRKETEEAIARVTQEMGTSVRNPVDSMNLGSERAFEGTLMPCALDPGVDLVLYHTAFGGMGFGPRRSTVDGFAAMRRQVETFRKVQDASGKPVVIAIRPSSEPSGVELSLAFQELCAREGLATYPGGVPRAAAALANLLWWQALRDRRTS